MMSKLELLDAAYCLLRARVLATPVYCSYGIYCTSFLRYIIA